MALIERFGLDVFRDCVERMYDHGESVVRECLERIPDGRYVGRGRMDNNGVDDDEIPFEVTVEVKRVRRDRRLLGRPGRADGADELPDRVDRIRGPDRDRDARRRRGRLPERGALPAA